MQHPHIFRANPAGQREVVAVIGLGKIGLPLAIQYAQHGCRVIGCDVNPQVVETITAGRCHIHEEPGLQDIVASAVRLGQLTASSDTTTAVQQAGVVVVIVPVMVDQAHEVDFRAIDSATQAVGAGLRPGTLVLYETTLPTGTTSGRLRALLEGQSGMKAGRDFHLAYSPERVSSGHIFRDLATYPKVVGGITATSKEAAIAFYRSVLDAEVIGMNSTDEAEFVKLIETTYRDVNIALANEFARYADRHHLDVMAAIAAANTQPYSHIHTPGVGVGGHCIPVYPYFLMRGARGGLELPRQARLINDGMAHYAVERIEHEIGSLSGRAVLILGVAYRGNIREVAFTSAQLLQEALAQRQARVFVDDPLYSDQELEAIGYLPLKAEQHGEIEAIILQADHQTYQSLDFSQYPKCQIVLDGRRALQEKLITDAGMRYLSIGDGQAPLLDMR